jgi:hypothetical protein
MTEVQERDEFINVVDAALDRFRGRDLVAAAEVVDMLLDLRLLMLERTTIADQALQELLEEPAPTSG